MTFKRIFLLASLALLFGSAFPVSLSAQGPDGGAEDYKRERIQDLIIMRLNNELGLNPSQSQQLAQIVRKHQQQRADLRRKQRELTAELRTASSGGGNDAHLQSLLKQLTSTRSQLDQINDQMFNEIKPMLSPVQQAKYLLVMDEIRQEIKAIRRPMMAPGYSAPVGGNNDAVRVGPPY